MRVKLMGVWKLAWRQDQFDSPLPAVWLGADESAEKPGTFFDDLEIRPEYANGLIYIDLGTMALGAVDGDPLTGGFEVAEGPMDGRV